MNNIDVSDVLEHIELSFGVMGKSIASLKGKSMSECRATAAEIAQAAEEALNTLRIVADGSVSEISRLVAENKRQRQSAMDSLARTRQMTGAVRSGWLNAWQDKKESIQDPTERLRADNRLVDLLVGAGHGTAAEGRSVMMKRLWEKDSRSADVLMDRALVEAKRVAS